MHAASGTANQAGLPMAFDYGSQRMCWFGHPVTNWMGNDGFLTRLYGEVRRFNYLGDTTWLKGRVSGKQIEGKDHLVDLEIWAENQLGEMTAKGRAQVSLPTRAPEWEGF